LRRLLIFTLCFVLLIFCEGTAFAAEPAGQQMSMQQAVKLAIAKSGTLLTQLQRQRVIILQAQAKSNLDLAKTTLDRDKLLLEAGVISQADLDAANNSYQSAQIQYAAAQTNLAETFLIESSVGKIINSSYDLETAAAQVKSAQAQLNIAGNNMDNLKIVAPFDGYVSKITGNIGQWTGGGVTSTSSTSTSQFSIELSSTKLQLKAEINEADISKVKTGQEATFTVDTYPR